ncbi:prepilin-type N-terminal cleavage/methylation domain-containing protein [bacterium]|nr:prepilin-type N-terminal cleavage/methylation domain-containing protein [bacterium]
MSIKQQKGFTLVELMVSVASMGILAAVCVPHINDYVVKVRNAEVVSNLRNVIVSQEAFWSMQNRYGTEAELIESAGLTKNDHINFVFPPILTEAEGPDGPLPVDPLDVQLANYTIKAVHGKATFDNYGTGRNQYHCYAYGSCRNEIMSLSPLTFYPCPAGTPASSEGSCPDLAEVVELGDMPM